MFGFEKAVAYAPEGYGPQFIAAGDLNGDGIQDLAVANDCLDQGCSQGGVAVLLGNGDGTFQGAVAYATGGSRSVSVAIGDVNGDGIPDLIVADQCAVSGCSDGEGAGGVSVLIGNGDGTFQTAVTYGSGALIANSVAVADVNGDGYPDLVVANSCETWMQGVACSGPGEVGVLLNNGDGTFESAATYSSGGYISDFVVTSDVNGDGYPDLVVTNAESSGGINGSVSVLLNNGNGTFQSPASYGSNGNAASVVAADLNGDGYPDLAVVNACQGTSCNLGSVNVFMNNRDGTFQPEVTYSTGGSLPFSIAAGDLNGDGYADLVVANACETGWKAPGCLPRPGWVTVLLGNGDGTFQSAVGYTSGGNYGTAVAIADLNGDGRPDLAVTNFSASKGSAVGSVGILLNKTSYKTSTALTSSPNPSQINQTVTFTATVSSTPAVPNGEVVTFYNGKSELGTGTTNNGVAALSTSFSAAATYTIKASYPGDAFHTASLGTVKQVVNP